MNFWLFMKIYSYIFPSKTAFTHPNDGWTGLYIKPHRLPQLRHVLPRFHAAHDTQVVLVATNATLEVVEQIAQLHADDQTRHAEEDVTPQLKQQNTSE